jgi:hypothetical protein
VSHSKVRSRTFASLEVSVDRHFQQRDTDSSGGPGMCLSRAEVSISQIYIPNARNGGLYIAVTLVASNDSWDAFGSRSINNCHI